MSERPIKKAHIKALLFCTLLIAVLSYPLIRWNTTRFSKITLDPGYPVSDAIVYVIDYAGPDQMTESGSGGEMQNANANWLTVNGWAGLDGEDTRLFNTSVLLKPKAETYYYKLSTEMQYRDDLESAPGYDYDFSRGGFVAKADMRRLPKGSYTICLLYKNNYKDYLVQTETSIEVN